MTKDRRRLRTDLVGSAIGAGIAWTQLADESLPVRLAASLFMGPIVLGLFLVFDICARWALTRLAAPDSIDEPQGRTPLQQTEGAVVAMCAVFVLLWLA